MPRRCLVCLSPDRAVVDEALVGGTPFRNVSKRHGLSVASLFRHRKEHIPGALVRVEEARKDAEAGNLYEKVRALEADAHRLKEKAEKEGDIRAALVAVDKLLDVIRLLHELRGPAGDGGPVFNIIFPRERLPLPAVVATPEGRRN